jgi:hypothetical protein
MTGTILYDLFDTIRGDARYGHPGLEEYYLLLELLRSEEAAFDSFDDLAFVLETCWLKSEQQRFAFRELLEQRREGLLQWVATLEREVRAAANVDNDATRTAAQGGADPVLPTGMGPLPSADPIVRQPAAVNTSGQAGLTASDTEFGDTGFRLDLDKTAAKTWALNVAAQTDKTFLQQPYLFTNDFFPIGNRALQQAWRRLINKQKARDSFELDVERTIAFIARQGYFSRFVYKKEEVNPLQLFIFLDQSDSMIAVGDFGLELCRTAEESQAHGELPPFYFNQYPNVDEVDEDDIVTNDDWTRSVALKRLFAPYPKKDIVVLIYSDAGALQKELHPERVQATQEFIRRLSRLSAYVAWLNPAPSHRWPDTNAGRLAATLPMFETSRNGLDGAIAALKGRSIIKNDSHHAAG